ncbi:hypothetical protein NUW58_g1328 [Xylaria curta]|uniref:Uncharacterized protein n=1 Tax=Xylaria curta TaxID=42375 RepID=A0ACC1PNM3_9PEZI|nr:hypothetical protein NUW58_g1328 [Xylaria curta]
MTSSRLPSPIREATISALSELRPLDVKRIGVELEGTRENLVYIRPSPSTLFIPIAGDRAKPHDYQALPQGHARFLRRVPQLNEDELIFEFISLPISDNRCDEEYIAISYFWGSLPADRLLVLADGSTVTVTAKVTHILQEIIYQIRCDIIWIDAVCINQQDSSEKSTQISLMVDIYSCAKSVEIWLDAGRPSVHDLSGALIDRDKPSISSDTVNILTLRNFFYAHKPYTIVEILELIWSPWFERAWVVQEYCYAKQHRFHYRGAITSSFFMYKVYEWGIDLVFGRIADGDRSRCEALVPPLIRHFRSLVNRNEHLLRRSDFKYPLEDILAAFYHCKSTEPHDKIVAFLGMANGEWLKNVTVDYDYSPTEFYLSIVLNMMSFSTDFALFGFAGTASRRPLFSDNPRVPSWLPDFSTAPRHDTWSRQWYRFNASGDPNNGGVKPDLFEFQSNEGEVARVAMMIAVGTCIDTVAGIIPGDEQRNVAHLPSFVAAALVMTHHLSPYPTGETPRDALRKTLIAADPICLKCDKLGAGFDELCEGATTGDLGLEKLWALKGRYYQTMLVQGAGGSRGLFWTKNGYMGLAANGIEVGDEIWLLQAARVPFILRGPSLSESREWKCQGYYELVTEAYIHGIMNGELSAKLKNDGGCALL